MLAPHMSGLGFTSYTRPLRATYIFPSSLLAYSSSAVNSRLGADPTSHDSRPLAAAAMLLHWTGANKTEPIAGGRGRIRTRTRSRSGPPAQRLSCYIELRCVQSL